MNEKECRRLVHQRSNSVCELCSIARAREVHHRKNRSQGGTWTPSNCLHLCSKDHRYITEHPQIAREQGWAVPSYADPAKSPVWVAWREFVFLDDHGNYQNKDGEAA